MSYFFGSNPGFGIFMALIAISLTSFGILCEIKIWRSRRARNKMLYVAAYGSQKEVCRVQLKIDINLNLTTPIPSKLWGKYQPERFGLYICSLLKITPSNCQLPNSHYNVIHSLVQNTSNRYQRRFLAGIKGRQHEEILKELTTVLEEVKKDLRHEKYQAEREEIFTKGLAS